MKSAIPAAAVLLGVSLMVLSALWATFFPATRIWTDEKSEQLSRLGSETNRLKFELVEAQNNPSMRSGRNAAEIQAEYDEVRKQYDELHEVFKTARDRPQTTAKSLRWTGVVLTAVGALFTFIGRGSG